MAAKTFREWQEFTQKALDLAGLDMAELSRLLTQKLGRKVDHSMVRSRIKLVGKAPKETEELNAWADCLKRDGHHREEFMRLALLERTPPDIRHRLHNLEEELQRTLRKLQGEERRSTELRSTLDKLRAELAEVTAQTTSLMQRLDRK